MKIFKKFEVRRNTFHIDADGLKTNTIEKIFVARMPLALLCAAAVLCLPKRSGSVVGVSIQLVNRSS